MSYFSSDLTLSKIQILYFLDKTNLELTTNQIAEVALENAWDDYFNIAHSLADLSEHNMLASLKRPIGQVYCISEQGKLALNQFFSRLASSKRDQIDDYIIKNQKKLARESSNFASYSMINSDEFLVECKIVESDTTLFTMTISVVSREIAKDICKRWIECAQNVYKSTINELFKEST